ncbi:MAG: hypothetical protein FK733_14995 [Asgard group archaeon]|nr:hypothetical protein [Asgard group archaeon]
MNEIESEKDPEGFESKRSFWDRIPKYKWWVTPLNILLICIFLVVIDIVTPPNTAFWRIDWAWWPIGGLFFAYIVSFIIFRRPAIAWVVGPILMVGTSILLLVIDLVFPPNDGLIGLDWATIPIAALLIFGVLIPIITKFGRKKEKPIDRFRKAIAEAEKDEM